MTDLAIRGGTSGLTSAEAAAALAQHGPNRLPEAPAVPAWRRLVAQLTHFFAALLWVAAVMALIAGMPQLAVAIALVVLINGVFAFLQERGAEQAARELTHLLPRLVRVRRDNGVVELDAALVVPGDVVLLGAGDAVPADAVAHDVHACSVDTSTLTGESVPDAVADGGPLFAGTFVTEGEATALIMQTGDHTRLAGIARLTKPPSDAITPLARQLHVVVWRIARIAVAVGVGFFGISLLVGTPLSDGFLFAVGVTVALVPEGLLPTVTVSLAIGARRMAARHALVRRLEAVATLGSTTFICTDKTGTLTRNEMEVVTAWTPAGAVDVHGEGYRPEGATVTGADEAVAALARAARAGRLCSNGRVVADGDGWRALGDPMEAALDALARRLAVADDVAIGVRHPFDPRRRRMSVVAAGELLVKGAPDGVFERCRGDVDAATSAVHAFAERGLRTLAVARRDAATMTRDDQPDDVESDLDLLAVFGLQDPPRSSAAAAIAQCRQAGIKVAMLTGDHPATARAIAAEVGLSVGDRPVLVGDELPTDIDVLGALVDRDGVVVARVSPEDKLRIAKALRRRGNVLAMTGDGVNDGPALSEADIGVAMGRSGTDVARAAADLVLLDDDFATIVEAVMHGRATFANVKRFLTYHLTDNVAELTPFVVWALSGGRFPLAIGVLQVLCLDIGTDLLPALALGNEAPAPDVLKRPPWTAKLLDRTVIRRAFGVLGPAEATMSMAAFVTGLVLAGWRPGHAIPTGTALTAASGAAFTAVVVGQMANAFACRSGTRHALAVGWNGNHLLRVAVVVELAALVAFLFVGPVARALDQSPPRLVPLLVALATAPVVLVVDGIDKTHRQRRAERARSQA